jgi:hypothetical protein
MRLLSVATPRGEKTIIVVDQITHLTATNIGTQVHFSSGKAVTVRMPIVEFARTLEELGLAAAEQDARE